MGRRIALWAVVAVVALAVELFFALRPARNARELGMMLSPGEEGALVLAVMEDSAADRAGVEPGDVLVSLDGRFPTAEDIRDSCFRYLDRGIPLVLERDGRQIHSVLGR